MLSPANKPSVAGDGISAPTVQRPLFRKYAMIFVAVVCSVLATNGALDIWFSYQEQKNLLVRIQREQAEAAATNIAQFIKEIENQLGWATLLPWNASTFDEWRLDVVRLLRQAPALTEVSQLDATGCEQFRISRYARDDIGSQVDHSRDPMFFQAMTNKVYYGPVYFVGGSEPYMTLSMVGSRHDYGVIVGQVNLKFIWDIVSQIKAGKRGQAYLVDGKARLIAHPDISLVLRNTDMSRLPQVRAAHESQGTPPSGQSVAAVDLQGQPVLSAYAPIAPLNWMVFVDVPYEEAFAPLYNSITRSGIILLVALALALFAALFITRRMVVPIRALHDGAARIGGGDLTQRISIRTGDELEALGDQFNAMALRLEESYATLERKVEERTRQLEAANLAKSRFLAAASHDLRQPLHALGLFVGQLRGRVRSGERRLIISRIETALSAMNELFNALLDISKLDAGAMNPNVSNFPVAQLLKYLETNFAEAARETGISLRIVQCEAWVRSDFILLERIVVNLVSNAVRYTRRGSVLVGCRKQESSLRIEVWDTGPGIPADQHQNIFGEFYRLAETDRDLRGGLGLGLAIVDRLCRLLNHPIKLVSTEGKGSCFSVTIPVVAARERIAKTPAAIRTRLDLSKGKLIVVVDDDPLVLEGMGGLFRSWGCQVVTANSNDTALAALAKVNSKPDLIISDYHLPTGKTGIEVIEAMRVALSAQIPAFLISGDTNPEPLREAQAKGFHLLHKPVEPMALRAMFNLALRSVQTARLH
jgi:signal transduction histidine kinase/CheY-like chemotaxis protein